MAMAVSASPLVERLRLRAELRQARQDAGLTQEAVAAKMDWSLSKIIRIETGSVGVSTNDLAALLRLYKIRDRRQVEDFIEQGRAARQRTWYSKYRSDLEPTYFQYIEYETGASIIRSYEARVIPGLLQTEEYATATIQLYRANRSQKKIKTLVEVRMKRQELLLGRSGRPLLFFILDEAAIHRLLDVKELREAQLEKLISLAEKPEVTIEVIPFSIGLHRGMGENFSILEFSGSVDEVIYFENARDQILSHETAEEIASYRELFEDLREASLGPEGTLRYLTNLVESVH
jgi:transcriptional regulator with XRE-family HTH domain